MSLPTEPTGKVLPDGQREHNNNAVSHPETSSQKQPILKFLSSGILAPLKVRDFRLLFGGQVISTVGDAFYAVALPWPSSSAPMASRASAAFCSAAS